MENLEEKNSTLKRISRCLYCNSTSYGKGCKYAPNGVHFHPDDPKKCSYCGSPNYGRGCKLNPTSNIHIHGINFNSMFNEGLKDSLSKHFLLKNLNKDYTEYSAYKLGVINESGEKIKEPITEEEKLAYSPGTKTILKIKKYLGSKLDLINQTAILEQNSNLSYKKENLIKLLEFEDKIDNIIEEFYKAAEDALENGLTFEQVEAIIQK